LFHAISIIFLPSSQDKLKNNFTILFMLHHKHYNLPNFLLPLEENDIFIKPNPLPRIAYPKALNCIFAEPWKFPNFEVKTTYHLTC
jgi:hypothetical protein